MRKAVVAVALLAALVVSTNAVAATPFNYSKRPRCDVRNPPIEPFVVGGTFIHGEIVQRCAGPVWKMGNYACLLAKKLGSLKPWRVVWCEANEVFFSHGTTVNVEDYVLPARSLWIWRVTGYVWVEYEPGNPESFYRFPVTSYDLLTYWHPDQRAGGRVDNSNS